MNADFDVIDHAMKELDNCGDKYCGHIITSRHIKEMEPNVLRFVNKRCRSKNTPKTEEEYKLNQQNYNTCFEKFKKRSIYGKKLTKRKKCEDKKCKNIQQKIKKILSSSTRKNLK